MTGCRHLISLQDLSTGDLNRLVERGAELSEGAVPGPVLAGCIVGTYFRKTSTRTRTAFGTGALRLGAGLITYGPHDLQENTGETVNDTARVLAAMLDILVARTAGPEEELRALASQDRMAVVNAMSAEEHPTQALADLTTLRCHFGRVAAVRMLYVGEGNNTAAALALALTRYPDALLELRTPPGYGLAAGVRRQAAAYAAASGAELVERHDMEDLPTDLDVVYTTRWETTGTQKDRDDWRDVFRPFRVDAALMARSPRAVFMHDLPAHRGDEVTGEVLDGPTSIAFEQARNKLYSAMAVLEWSRLAVGRADIALAASPDRP
jgi:ornithine carbamoyltransferase